MRGALLGFVGGLVLAAPATAADHPIAFASYAYNPPDITIAVNDTATFNGQFGDHPLDWDGNVYGETNTGSSRTFTFTTPGTYTYFCRFHVDTHGMKGVIRVAGNQHPARVSFSVSPAAPTIGQPVTFAYTGDPDPDGTLVRWEWDLDGDGSFETSTSTATTTRTYTSLGTVIVRMRAIDNGSEASAVAEQAVTIAAAGGGGAAGSGSSELDRTAPLATRLRLRGLTLAFRSSEHATATATLRRRGRTLARGSAKAGATTIRLKLTKAGRSALRRGHRVKATLSLTLRDASGNARTVKRRLTVRPT
jgi:plastocyanin